jgi:hypothetical protein
MLNVATRPLSNLSTSSSDIIGTSNQHEETMSFATGLIIGLVAGGLLGVMLLALMVMSRRSDERIERMNEGQ